MLAKHLGRTGCSSTSQQKQQQPQRGTRCRHRPVLVRAPAPPHAAARSSSPATSTALQQLHICTGKVCRKQGSPAILKFAQELGLEDVAVSSSGCLGNCGQGPNMLLMPRELHLRHVSTVSDMLDVLQQLVNIPPAILQATQLRLAGNALAMGGDLQGAVGKYQEALALGPGSGRHMLLSNLAAAQLQLGAKEEAAAAAAAAVACAPRGFHVAHVRLVDCLFALNRREEAADALRAAVAAEPAFTSLPEYRLMQQALKQQLKQHA